MWELITLYVMNAWNKVFNRSWRLHWFSVTVCPWVASLLDKLLPWLWLTSLAGEDQKYVDGRRGAVMCAWRPEGGQGQCDWQGASRVSAQQQGDQGAVDLPQLCSRFTKWMSRSPMLFTYFTQTLPHTFACTLSQTHTCCLRFECWPCWADRVSRCNTSLWQQLLFA